ncbi:MAG: ROK family transcriptional regulator [Victivallales bacterium]|nr:ROK family transcriptional regulator [Victivallales bacterium]
MDSGEFRNNSKTKVQNQLNVLSELRRCGFVSNAELSRIFKVPPTSTLRILSSLEELGCIKKSFTEKNRGKVGKPAAYFEVSSDAGVVMVVDAGVRTTAFALVDYAGKISGLKVLETADIIQNYAEAIADEISMLKGKCDLPEEQIVVVVAVSGSVSGNILRTRFLPAGYDLKGRLEQLLGREVYMENDANLAVMAEKDDAGIYSPTSVLCILDRSDVGTGIVIDGKLYRGFSGVAGEVYDVVRKARHTGIYLDVFAHAEIGDAEAVETLDGILEELTDHFVRLVRMLDPEYFIFAGEVSKAGNEFQKKLIERIEGRGRMTAFNMPEIIFSRLGDLSVIAGAGWLGIGMLDGMFLSGKV